MAAESEVTTTLGYSSTFGGAQPGPVLIRRAAAASGGGDYDTSSVELEGLVSGWVGGWRV